MPGPEQWIVVPKWEEFQHPDTLRTGSIPWVKTFTRLLSDSSYLSLSAGERAVLHGIWLEYARARGQLTLDTQSLSRRLSLRVTKRQLESLNHAGFITFSASRPASTTASKPASTDKRRQEKTLRARTRETTQTTDRPYTCAGHNEACGIHLKTSRELHDHLAHVHQLDWAEPGTLEAALKTGSPT